MKKIVSLFLAALMLVSALGMLASCGGDTELVAVDATDLVKEDFGIAVKKGSADLLAAVNAVVDKWVADGTMKKYEDYYTALAEYAEAPEGKTEPDAAGLKTVWDFGTATEVITVYTESGFAPFEFLYNNAVVGVDMAIMSEVAVNMGKKIEIKDIGFDTIPTAVQNDTGLAVGAAGLTINEERAEKVDFSNVYYSSTLVIVSAKKSSFDSVASLSDLKVGVQKGTSGDLIISAAKTADGHKFTVDDVEKTVTVSTKTEVKTYEQYALALADLKAGRIDAILMDKLPAQTMLNTAQ